MPEIRLFNLVIDSTLLMAILAIISIIIALTFGYLNYRKKPSPTFQNCTFIQTMNPKDLSLTFRDRSEEMRKEPDESISRLEQPIALKPEDDLYRGIDLFQKGKYEYSLQAFEKSLELKPDFAEAWHNKGVVLTKLGRPAEYARKAFEEAGKLNPNFAQRYLFSWDEIPGNDSGRLIDFLEKIFGINWVKTAIIKKTDDGKTINVYTKEKSLSLTLNDEKKRVSLKIDEGTYIYTAEMMNGKLNIYTGIIKDSIVAPFRK